jgi:hypothetical protein
MSPEDDLTMMGDYKTMQAISILVDGGVCFVRRRSTS